MTRDPLKIRISALIRRSWRFLVQRMIPHASRQHEILKDAIQYLSDEFVFEEPPLAERGGRMEAIQLLMSRIPSSDVRNAKAVSIRNQVREMGRQSVCRTPGGVSRASRI